MLNIEEYKLLINDLCQNRPVKRLDLFGSSLTDSFSVNSDVDVLVVFDADKTNDYFNHYFDLKENLEKIFNRSVDLVINRKFKNPYFQKVIDRTRKIIYER